MAEPLTKLSRAGEHYARPPSVERNIDDALETLERDEPALVRRLAVIDPASAGYLKSECLVHLVRDLTRRRKDHLRDQVLTVLLKRCEAILKSKVPASNRFDAAFLREEILSEFAVLFVQDGTGEIPNELDYFECRFNQAFRSLRIDMVRQAVSERKEFDCLPEASAEEDTRGKGTSPEPSCRPTQSDGLDRRDLLNSLSEDVRTAVVLRDMGFKDESEDPTEITAATLCGVTGKTIRNRLKLAREHLAPVSQEEL